MAEEWEWDTEDDPIIVEYEFGDEHLSNEGHQINLEYGYDVSSGITEHTRSYTEVSGGKIRFGYRAQNSNTKTEKYVIEPVTYETHQGIKITADKIKIYQDANRYNTKLLLRSAGKIGVTGYLQVITEIQVSSDNGVFWTVSRIPFQNGLCVYNPNSV